MLALHLLQSALVHVNTLLLQAVLADPTWQEADRRRPARPVAAVLDPREPLRPVRARHETTSTSGRGRAPRVNRQMIRSE